MTTHTHTVGTGDTIPYPCVGLHLELIFYIEEKEY